MAFSVWQSVATDIQYQVQVCRELYQVAPVLVPALGDRAQLYAVVAWQSSALMLRFVTSTQVPSGQPRVFGTRYRVLVGPTMWSRNQDGPNLRQQLCQPLSYQAWRAKEVPRPVRRSRSARFPTFVLTPGVRRGSRGRCQDALSVKVHTGLYECPRG